jgi:hypothetical protein
MRSLVGIAASVGCVLFATQALAVSSSVKSACKSDYRAYCGQHDPEGAEVRTCMRANSSKLSQRCVDALITAGEVSKTEVARWSRSEK